MSAGWRRSTAAAPPPTTYLIAEAAGLFIAATAFSGTPQQARWAALAAGILEQEALTQTFADGLNRELAFGYHGYVLGLLLSAAIEGEAQRAAAVRRWSGMRLDAGWPMHWPPTSPWIPPAPCRRRGQGDGDDAVALLVDAPESGPWSPLLELASKVLGPQRLVAQAAGPAPSSAKSWRRWRATARPPASAGEAPECLQGSRRHLPARGGRRDLRPGRSWTAWLSRDRGPWPCRCPGLRAFDRRPAGADRSRHLLLSGRAGMAALLPLDLAPQHAASSAAPTRRSRPALPLVDPAHQLDRIDERHRGRRAGRAHRRP